MMEIRIKYNTDVKSITFVAEKMLCVDTQVLKAWINIRKKVSKEINCEYLSNVIS